MRILDFEGNEVTSPDYELGQAVPDTIVLCHHEAVEAVEEQWHYEVLAVYPNGSREMIKVVDVPGIPAQDPWDETEEILRWVPYTEEELAERAAQAASLRADAEAKEEYDRQAAEAAAALERENALLRARVSALMEQQQFLEDCIVEMAEILYA